MRGKDFYSFSPDRPFHFLGASLNMCTTFLIFGKFTDLLILRLPNCERAGLASPESLDKTFKLELFHDRFDLRIFNIDLTNV